MADDDAPPNPNPKPTICEACRSNPWKYRCPGCSFLSCSLPCVQSHKQRTGCTGKRARTEILPLDKFDDDVILSDYSLLEDAKRVADSAHRMITKFGSTVRFPPAVRVKLLRDAARRRGTWIFVLPRGMERRDKNKSHLNQKYRRIYWTVEWKFHMAGVSLIDHGVGEHLSLSSAIEKHLEPSPWNSQLRPYSNAKLDDLKFFIQKNAMRTKSVYCQLNARAPIISQFKNVSILEYPVIHVYLPSESYDFQVIREKKPSIEYEEPSERANTDSNPNVKLFREEEIQESEVPFETQVIDLLHHRSSDNGGSSRIHRDDIMKKEKDCYQDKQTQVATSADVEPSFVSKHRRIMKKEKDCCQDKQTQVATSADLEPSFVSKHRRVMEEHNICFSAVSEKLLEEEKFDFEQEVKDAYSDLVGEVDPDDFLCFDGGYEEDDLGELPSSFFADLRTVDELEEGEIPS